MLSHHQSCRGDLHYQIQPISPIFENFLQCGMQCRYINRKKSLRRHLGDELLVLSGTQNLERVCTLGQVFRNFQGDMNLLFLGASGFKCNRHRNSLSRFDSRLRYVCRPDDANPVCWLDLNSGFNRFYDNFFKRVIQQQTNSRCHFSGRRHKTLTGGNIVDLDWFKTLNAYFTLVGNSFIKRKLALHSPGAI